MFILIPLAVLVLAVGAMVWLVGRKLTYLKKLSPETLAETVTTDHFLAEMYPEIAAWLERVNLRAYGVSGLNELEKFLRKLRLVSLRVDDTTNRLIRRVRQSSQKQEQILNQQAVEAAREEANAEDDLDYSELGHGPAELKPKEQLLIIEIAKHPKDALLYKELGVVYMRLEEWEDARQSFAKALELDPADETIKRKLGRVLAKIKKEEKPM